MRFNLKQEVFLITFTAVLNICYKGFQLLYIHLFLFYKLGNNTCVAFDDAGRSFRNFGVKFIPFCVICNKRKAVMWCGHAGTLNQQVIDRIINSKTK